MLIADRLAVPEGTGALLWDMDGVLLDTLTMDYDIVNKLLADHPGVQTAAEVPRSIVRAYFPYDVADFWPLVLAATGRQLPEATVDELICAHRTARAGSVAPVHSGVVEILQDARRRGLRSAVVSNNPESEVAQMLAAAGLGGYFSTIVGNDNPGMRKKPAPDPYLEAARRLAASAQCVAVEDSLLGARAAKAAGCWTVGVATGASDFAALSSSPDVDLCYVSLTPWRVELGRAGVTQKSLHTPNEFVSHMIEHIAWRLGCSIDVTWTSDDWARLGRELGQRIAGLGRVRDSAAALGMIDDGSCELALHWASDGGVRVRGSAQVDLDWFLALRCEQLTNGAPLVSLLHGLGAGCGVDLDLLVANAEDPHHTWEAIFRAVGIGLHKLTAAGEPGAAEPAAAPAASKDGPRAPHAPRESAVERGWQVTHASTAAAGLRRETAESVVAVELSLGAPEVTCMLAVSDSIEVGGIADLLGEFASAGNMRLNVDFSATRLSSSHVVTEDIGLALGRALRCIAVERMVAFGINGAGANLDSVADLTGQPVRVGVSMEGRKFWKFVPFDWDYPDFRKSFLIGHTLPNGLFSEDLDDFIDGFAGGLQASVIVHIPSRLDPGAGWPLVFRGLGAALGELLAANPDRRALAPGVKATLA